MSSVLDPPVAHPATAAVAGLRREVEGLLVANLWSMSEPELLEHRRSLEQITARLDSARLASTREIDSRGAAVATGAPTTAAWLRGSLHLHPAAAKREVAVAEALDGDLPATAQALAAGEISRAHAEVVVATVAAIPARVPAETRAQGEAFLLEHARSFDPDALRKLGRHLRHVVDPDHGDTLAREEEDAVEARHFTLIRRPDGSADLRGRLDAEGAAFLSSALSPLSAPHPATDGTKDPRTAARRRGDALIDLARAAMAAGELPEEGGEPVTVLLEARLETLESRLRDHFAHQGQCHHHDERSQGGHDDRPEQGDHSAHDGQCDSQYEFHERDDWVDFDHHGQAGERDPSDAPGGCDQCVHPDDPEGTAGEPGGSMAARFEDGTALSAEAARRLACDAKIVAAVLGSVSQVLDIGRASQAIPRSIRRALIARDGGCAFPGCDRPPAWCQAHHIWHWADGGPTCITNLVLLCGHHHRVVHHHGWQVHIGPHGIPIFTPPRWVDPDQVPISRPWRTSLDQLALTFSGDPPGLN